MQVFGFIQSHIKVLSMLSASGYDSGEKKRIPAWCDRVIFRDTRTSPESECSLDCPVVASIML